MLFDLGFMVGKRQRSLRKKPAPEKTGQKKQTRQKAGQGAGSGYPATTTWNFDVGLGAVRSVVRGEVAGSVRLVAFVLLALAVWVAVSWTADWTAASASSLAVQEGRYRTLVALAEEYRALAPAAGSGTEAVDVPTVFTQVSERMSLGSRVNLFHLLNQALNQGFQFLRLKSLIHLLLKNKLLVRIISLDIITLLKMPNL